MTKGLSVFALGQNDSSSVVHRHHHQHIGICSETKRQQQCGASTSSSTCIVLSTPPPDRFLHASSQATRSRRSNYPPVLAFTNVSSKRGRNYSAPFFTCKSGGVISQITPLYVSGCAVSPSVASERRRSNYGTLITPPHVLHATWAEQFHKTRRCTCRVVQLRQA